MGWKFSSSCHIDSSFSVKKTSPLCAPHRKRALGSSSRAHSTLIPGLLRGQRRSPLQHLGSQKAFKTAQLTVLVHRSYVRSMKQHHALSPFGPKIGNSFYSSKGFFSTHFCMMYVCICKLFSLLFGHFSAFQKNSLIIYFLTNISVFPFLSFVVAKVQHPQYKL